MSDYCGYGCPITTAGRQHRVGCPLYAQQQVQAVQATEDWLAEHDQKLLEPFKELVENYAAAAKDLYAQSRFDEQKVYERVVRELFALLEAKHE